MLIHMDPKTLNETLMKTIENSLNASNRKYDALILGFGLCGNAAVGLSCSIPMIIPRVHDCCTVHMGSKERFLEVFGNSFSARWCSTGYYERGRLNAIGFSDLEQLSNHKTTEEYRAYLETYDEETADYIWETLHPKMDEIESVYIEIDGFEYSNTKELYKADMEGADVKLKTVKGDITMLRDLINGNWNNERFLTVPPNKKIVGIYDMDRVMESE
ncbi:MAG: DUF1638 domain-containing protein [Oscillospiraceae bacterium]|nr:DUF1638 domain-containing protein [Oscillospiraceae bacterium]